MDPRIKRVDLLTEIKISNCYIQQINYCGHIVLFFEVIAINVRTKSNRVR